MIGNKTFVYRTSHNTTCNSYIHNTIYNGYINLQRNLLPQSMFRRPVNFYQTTRYHKPEGCYLHSYTCKNLKPFKAMNLYFHKMSYLNNNCSAPSSRMSNWGDFLTSSSPNSSCESYILVQINFPQYL